MIKKKKKMTRNDSSLFKRLYLTIIFNDYIYYSEYRLYSLQIFQ